MIGWLFVLLYLWIIGLQVKYVEDLWSEVYVRSGSMQSAAEWNEN
jgi:hypothetical protein